MWANQGPFYGSTAVSGDVAYIGTTAVNATSGKEIWNFHTGNQIAASPAISNGVLYIASQDGYFYAIGEPIIKPSPTPANTLLSSPTFWVGLTIIAVALIAIALKYRKKRKNIFKP